VFYTFASEPDDPHRYDLGSVWMLMENVSLAAVPMGLGTQIFTYWNEAETEVDRRIDSPGFLDRINRMDRMCCLPAGSRTGNKP